MPTDSGNYGDIVAELQRDLRVARAELAAQHAVIEEHRTALAVAAHSAIIIGRYSEATTEALAILKDHIAGITPSGEQPPTPEAHT